LKIFPQGVVFFFKKYINHKEIIFSTPCDFWLPPLRNDYGSMKIHY